MTFTGFAPIALPSTAFRRSWLLEAVEDLSAGQRCIRILRELGDEKRAGLLDPRDAKRCLIALYDHVEGLGFPVNTGGLREGLEWENDPVADVLAHGIPIEPLGWHPEQSRLAFDMAILTYGTWMGDHGLKLDDVSMADIAPAVTKWVMSWWPGKFSSPDNWRGPRAPRGRDFVSPWDGLPDLAAYCGGTVVRLSEWLTVNFEEQYESGNNPAWDAAHIRFMAKDWAAAKPVWDRIDKLADYVEAKPLERLKLFDSALRGERAALLQVTRPKPGTGRTLAQIFSKGKR